MVEAGMQAIFEFRDEMAAWGLAEVVYRAMERARKDQQKTAPP
jgi:hypothetical protein